MPAVVEPSIQMETVGVCSRACIVVPGLCAFWHDFCHTSRLIPENRENLVNAFDLAHVLAEMVSVVPTVAFILPAILQIARLQGVTDLGDGIERYADRPEIMAPLEQADRHITAVVRMVDGLDDLQRSAVVHSLMRAVFALHAIELPTQN